MSKQTDLAKVARDAGTGYVNITGDTMSGTLTIPTLAHTGWGGSLDRSWGGFPSIRIDNDSGLTQTEFRIHGDSGTAGPDLAVNLRVDGKLITQLQTQPNSVSDAVAVTVNTTTPTVIASTTITTTGKPVLLVATGDGNPNQQFGWHRAQFAIGGTSIGKLIISENAGNISCNNPFAICHIHQPAAGTHTFQLRVWQGSGSFTFGEEGNSQAPTILAMEIL